MSYFSDLGLSNAIMQALEALNYKEATPIQTQAIPAILAGRDCLGIAQTGTGKTAAFALPILELLSQFDSNKPLPKALILTPTRELAVQILTNLKAFGKFLPLKFGCMFGGVKERPQIQEVKSGVHILVATPGRLLDLYRRKLFSLKGIQFCVLDEADRMLDMGFLPSIRTIIKELPKDRQTLLFSATLPKEIEVLSENFLKNPVRIAITPPATTAERIEQHLLFVPKGQKLELLQRILNQETHERVIIFSKTKFGAERIGRTLRANNIDACILHGDKTQKERQRALNHFQQGTIPLLIATDVASRGIDVSNITHVINFDLPTEPESYVHRIGRTGRAGQNGIAFSFCDPSEKPLLKAIERQLLERIPVLSARQFWPDFVPAKTPTQTPKKAKRNLRSRKNKSKFKQ